MSRPRTIVLCSGEMSGDTHAAALVAHLRNAVPGARILAMGGDGVAAAGAELIHHYRDYAFVGFTDVLLNLGRLLRLEKSLRKHIDAADLFVAVDYPGLNLRLCRHARERGVRVLYYISPQVWAWGEKRTSAMARNIDSLAVILPFEVEFLKRRGVHAEFVGHPLIVDRNATAVVSADDRAGVGLLPGSREQEVRRILPVLLAAARRIAAEGVETRFAVGRSSTVPASVYRSLIAASGVEAAIDDDANGVMASSKLALVASGTATLECALAGTPMVVVYRVSPLNYALAKRLVRTPHIGLVNIVLEKRVAPELIQSEATPERIATEALSLLRDEARRNEMTGAFATLRTRLSGGEGTRRVAQMAAELLA